MIVNAHTAVPVTGIARHVRSTTEKQVHAQAAAKRLIRQKTKNK